MYNILTLKLGGNSKSHNVLYYLFKHITILFKPEEYSVKFQIKRKLRIFKVRFIRHYYYNFIFLYYTFDKIDHKIHHISIKLKLNFIHF